MFKGKIRHLFPGGNTSQGFFSYYDNILSQEEATRIIIIKGGPGVGKSTFMKKIAQEMLDRGYDAEFLHCSSDNNSLDGVLFPAFKVAFIDGTAPHVVDPKNPGAVDEIIHLGDFWNEEGMRANRELILKTNKEVGRLFVRAYRYIKAAASIYEDTAVIHGWAINTGKVNEETASWIEDILGDQPISGKVGKQRHLFASAITPDGYRNYLDTLLTAEKVYMVRGQQGTGTETVVKKIKEAAVDRGLFVESFYCALQPQKVEHLLIPELNTAITTSNEYHHLDVKTYKEINLDEYLDRSMVADYVDVLRYNHEQFNALMKRAITTIRGAKELHDLMETYYIPNMDFDSVQNCWECTLARVLEYAGEDA
jgi:GTPase SAR1 family protein